MYNLPLSITKGIKMTTVSVKKSRNSKGKALANAGELATIHSLYTDITTPEDTKQDIFINDYTAFQAWETTFKYTKEAINKLVPNLDRYNIIHDGTDKSDFTGTIKQFCKKVHISKNSWNPADIYIIDKDKQQVITTELQHIIQHHDDKSLTRVFNNKIYDLYEQEILFPISLKQLHSNTPKNIPNNIPNNTVEDEEKQSTISIYNFNCNLSEIGSEIGVFSFNNEDTGNKVLMQVRGFPHGYTTAQTEITSDGSTGGRLGKVPTKIIDSVFFNYGDERIKSINFFGYKKFGVFSKFDIDKIKQTYEWYSEVISNQKVTDLNPLSYQQYVDMVEYAKQNYEFAENLCQKIQGLKIMHFFTRNEDKISPIMNELIDGARKVGKNNGFFIQIC